MRRTVQAAALAVVALTAGGVLADPTWPSPNDELESIMFELTSFHSRKFADTVNPCSNEASGPGRRNAAEWLRTAFHDMSTASVYFGTGGLDASLQYELKDTENLGPGLTTTIEFMGPFLSPRSSLADLIAMGVYTSVRSCGGPQVPIRGGRIDAATKGNTGVPQPQNSAYTFQQQFDRMGFSAEEMIQVTACGHTLGGVHSNEFPDIVTAGTGTDGQIGLDNTTAAFDNAVVTEYLDGTTVNPLVVGPAVKVAKNSDFKVFNSDGNKTMKAMADPASFRDTCRTVLAKMIDVVPPGVNLTAPITPYNVKPVDMQLTLSNGGASLVWKGFIRVKAPSGDDDASAIDSVRITYKDREGASCTGCSISSTVQGIGRGFDDTFAFFPIDAVIPASRGISGFVVDVKWANGTETLHDNNGHDDGYPLQDSVILQKPQSCLLASSGNVTLTAAVRNDVAEAADAVVEATVWYKTPQTDKSPAPKLSNSTVVLEKRSQSGCKGGKYTTFASDWTVPGGLASEAYIDVKSGGYVDAFKSAGDLGARCQVMQCNGTNGTAGAV